MQLRRNLLQKVRKLHLFDIFAESVTVKRSNHWFLVLWTKITKEDGHIKRDLPWYWQKIIIMMPSNPSPAVVDGSVSIILYKQCGNKRLV